MAFEAIKLTAAICSSALSKEAEVESQAFTNLVLKAHELQNSLKGQAREAFRKYMILFAQNQIMMGTEKRPPGTTDSTKYELEAELVNTLQTESGVPSPLPELANYAAACAAIADAKFNKKMGKIYQIDKIKKIMLSSKSDLLKGGVSEEEFNKMIKEMDELL